MTPKNTQCECGCHSGKLEEEHVSHAYCSPSTEDWEEMQKVCEVSEDAAKDLVKIIQQDAHSSLKAELVERLDAIDQDDHGEVENEIRARVKKEAIALINSL